MAGNSASWSSPHSTHTQQLVRLQNSATHIGVFHSPFFPKNMTEYLSHRTGYADDMALNARNRMNNRIEEIVVSVKVGIFLNGKVAGDEMSGVLALPTMWRSGIKAGKNGGKAV